MTTPPHEQGQGGNPDLDNSTEPSDQKSNPSVAQILGIATERFTPEVEVTRVFTSQGTRLVTIHCIYCGKKHQHGWPLTVQGDPGLRLAHCRSGQGLSYFIAAPKQVQP